MLEKLNKWSDKHDRITTALFVLAISVCFAWSIFFANLAAQRYAQERNAHNNGVRPRGLTMSQKCDMCGAQWWITPVENPDEVVPPTVEWCFHDGAYCKDGFAMIMEQHEKGESQELERRWLNHCLSCKGCRCAAFEPEEWRKITDAIEKVRSDSVR